MLLACSLFYRYANQNFEQEPCFSISLAYRCASDSTILLVLCLLILDSVLLFFNSFFYLLELLRGFYFLDTGTSVGG